MFKKTRLNKKRRTIQNTLTINMPIHCQYTNIKGKAQSDSIRSQTIHYKGTSYDITKYQTFLTKYEIVCPLKGHFFNSR